MPRFDDRTRRAAALVAAAALLTLALPATALATFAGTNGRIFYEGPASGTDVFSISPLGGEADNLTESGEPNEQRPAASADGRVAFQAFDDEGWNIFKMNADGSGVVNLTKTKHPAVINFEPTWSPDGSEVVYMRQDASGQDLWRVGADGSNPENLTETAGVEESGAEFSPDGTRIAYVGTGPKPCCDPEYNNDIWVMDADGTDQEQLTKTNYPQQNLSPTWSPDGAKIAYSAVPSEGGSDAGLHVMDADGTDQVRPLSGAEPIFSINLSWSPDGTKIVYQRMAGGLKTVSPDGSDVTTLVDDAGAAYPSWAPAGSGEEEEEEEEEEGGGGEEEGGGGTPTTPAPSPGPTPLLTGTVPSNAVALGKVKLDKAKGTATLTVTVPGPGKLALGGKGVKAVTKAVAMAGKATLPVKAAGKALKKLNAKGAVALKAKVTFTPTGGTPGTATKSLTLKKQI